MLKSKAVDAALQRCIELGEIGVQVAAYLNGELVVDAWTGLADRETGRAVDGDTLFPSFSTIKAVTATALHIQAEHGLIEYDAPVSRYWPEFGANGKDRILIRHVLEHRSGICVVPEGTTRDNMLDWEWMVRGLANLPLMFPPGEKAAYQSWIFGWLVGEVVCRTDPKGRAFGQFVREEICAPLGIEDLWIGLPPAEEPRVAKLYQDPPAPHAPPPRPLATRTSPAGWATADTFNRHDVHQACVPGGNGIWSARSMARFYAMLAGGGELNGVRLLSRQRVWSLLTPRSRRFELDEALNVAPMIGTGGFWLSDPAAWPGLGTSIAVICHPGHGGSLAWADLESGLSVGFCHNRLFGVVPPPPPDMHPHTAVGEAIRQMAFQGRRES